ncbi:hypothetical protein SSP35_12_01160 [Streptomyces sp. NBRC 110611]|nr:hypothetical protein SSP35_12_01160 [Streptomyces sp. NBRC 110611]
MTDMKPSRAATEGTWIGPLLLLAPVVAIRLLAEPSTLWKALSWGFCGLSAVLVVVGWTAVVRHGMRGLSAWISCILVHALLAWQVIALVTQ